MKGDIVFDADGDKMLHNEVILKNIYIFAIPFINLFKSDDADPNFEKQILIDLFCFFNPVICFFPCFYFCSGTHRKCSGYNKFHG